MHTEFCVYIIASFTGKLYVSMTNGYLTTNGFLRNTLQLCHAERSEASHG